MSITHTFLDFIPSTYIGAPTSDTALSVLPAHKLLLKGQGYEAIKLSTIGSLLGLIAIVLLTLPLLLIIPKIYTSISKIIPYILITATFFLIIKERESKLYALFIFLLSGILGIIVLNLKILSEPLFPLFSGLFGTSMLFLSLKDKINIPQQTLKTSKIKNKNIAKAISSGVFSSLICGLLPGIGSAEAAIISSSFFKKITTKTYIILVGSINTIAMVVSFIALFSINKARNGSVVVISEILTAFSKTDLTIFISVSLITAGLATFLSLFLAKRFSKLITKINYQKLCIGIISLIAILVLIISGPLGFLVLIVSTFVGFIPPLKGIGRHHLMGSLIVPVTLFFLL